MTSDSSAPRLPKWPFLLGDSLLVGVAVLISFLAPRPLDLASAALLTGAVVCGAWLGVLPFLKEHRASVELTGALELKDAVAKLQQIEQVRDHIAAATAQWQHVQDESGKTVKAAGDIADRISAEAKAFAEFLQKAHDAERAHLRLEIEKLRRGEGEWLQVVVRLLDHVFALHKAAVRSGQPQVIEQLSQFQNACRDAARRVGLTPLEPAAGEAFNPELHQLLDAETAPQPDAVVAETLATGYTFQGQLVRRAAVALALKQAADKPAAQPALKT